jgi:trimeric autotransporter adhesin
MLATWIEKYAAIPLRAALLAAILVTGGCGSISDDPPPPGSSGFAVRGSATGVLGPVSLAVQTDGESEQLTLTQEGAFAFNTRIEAGASYTVALVNPKAPCALRNETGVIGDADAAIELTCTGASLASLVVSGVAPSTVTLVPGKTDYTVDLPLLQQSARLTATVGGAGDTLAIAGTEVESGTPSQELTLGLGDNPVDIVVENPLGWQRTYRLTLRRAAPIAQYAYGKASNTGKNDQFGVSVALSGDTLAVGAWAEDSVAKGVDGDQTNNGAVNSGAVYVFRRTGTAWKQEAYLKASNTGAGDQFGWSVALSGDTLAVSASFEDSAAAGVDGNQNDNSSNGSGAAYVFHRMGTSWQQEAYVKASNTGAGDEFGWSVALSGDTLAVGVMSEDSAAKGVGGDQAGNGAAESGAVYVFH